MAMPDFASQLANENPAFRDMALRFLQAAYDAGLDPRIQETTRPADRQAALYAQGRTAPGPIVTYAKPGNSAHNHGLAFDVVPGALLGTKNWSPENPMWSELGRIAAANGLEWGGNWKMGDKPHIQMPDWRKYQNERSPVQGQPQAPGTPAPAMPAPVNVAERQVAQPMSANTPVATQTAEQPTSSGLGDIFAALAPGAGQAAMAFAAPQDGPTATEGSGDPMGATMAALQAAQKAKGLASGLAPNIDALMSLGKRPGQGVFS